MRFDVLTLFPELIQSHMDFSIMKRASDEGIIEVVTHNPRDYTLDKHKKVDDTPYGGGAGMVMQAQPIYDCFQSILDRIEGSYRCLYMTPQGKTFKQAVAKQYVREENLIFLCGHYEGVDERVIEEIVDDYVSLGDFVLTGGELPAIVMVDAISRLIPGVLHNDDSACTESFENGLLEYPQYSRPEEWRGKKVPEILLSGDHAKVDAWRLSQSIERTRALRPDLLAEIESI